MPPRLCHTQDNPSATAMIVARLCVLTCMTLALACGAETAEAPIICAVDADCAGLDPDANLCNGAARCVSGRCIYSPQPKSCSTASPCLQAACVPATGECETVPVFGDVACSDGDPCTDADGCVAGVCVGGAPRCTDAAQCTVATCDAVTGECGSEPVADFTPCEDGDPCTTGPICVGGICAGKAVECEEDDNPCTLVTCDGGDCLPLLPNDGVACDDGDPCTVDDLCENKLCNPGGPACEDADGTDCLAVSCDAATGDCISAPVADGEGCEDGDPCTVADTCLGGECGAGGPKCTENPDPCLNDVCHPLTGVCQPQAVPGTPPCNDQDPCTLQDSCAGGLCAGVGVQCPDDGNPCSVAACGATGACDSTLLADGSKCDDGSACTVGDNCQGGECEAAPKCPDDGNGCTIESCSDEGDCSTSNAADGAACEDGNPCTAGETCESLTCGGGDDITCPDDGDPCTQELCIPEAGGGCISVAAPDDSECDDGNPCTEEEVCLSGACGSGAAAECPDDGEPCTLESCDPTLGCVAQTETDGTLCDDGDACTADTTCQSGACQGPEIVCATSTSCMQAACDPGAGCFETALPDDLPCDDDDLCTGGGTCAAGLCITGGATDCPQPGDPCLVGVCVPATGACTTAAAADGTLCDEGDPCTMGDTCDAGECAAGPPVDCGLSFDPCTALSCNPGTGACQAGPIPDGGPCDDDNPCATSGTCQDGACSSEPIVECPPPTDPCMVALCDPNTGACVEIPAGDGQGCDDGDACTTGTLCSAQGCVGGSPVVCADDGDSCSFEKCLPEVGCTFDPEVEGTPCGDGDPCTVDAECQSGACVATVLVTCPDDGDPCTNDECVPALGCAYPLEEDGAPCDDESLCTSPDTCTAGVCGGTAQVTCDNSGDPCVPNVCQPDTGECAAQSAPDGASCDDENLCSVEDRCQAGVCQGAALACPQDNDPCTVSQCDPGPGKCVTGPSGSDTPCDDDLACTVGDACDGAGGCAGSAKDCPAPTQPCRVAVCDPADGGCGIAVATNGTACVDDDLCTAGDFCLQGECVSGTQPACVPTGPCRAVSCTPETGACSETILPNGSICNDKDACTAGEACTEGECEGGAATVCEEDDNECTTVSCSSTSGLCEAIPNADGQECADGDPCTELDGCVQGACAGTPLDCPPSPTPCAENACDPELAACALQPLSDGDPCEDGDVCTSGDTCVGGACVATPTSCPLSANDCQVSLCEPGVGCVLDDANEGGPCFDLACSFNTTCVSGTCQGGEPIDCGPDPSVCQVRICSETLGCHPQAALDGGECDDGDACTDGEQCADGLCVGAAVECDAPPPCHTVACDVVEGCLYTPVADSVPCSDGLPCTVDDVCQGGACEAGPEKACDAGTECQPEACDPTSGQCAAGPAADGTECDDGDPCTTGATCTSGTCGDGSTLACEQPGDPCLVAACSATTGQCELFAGPDAASCDDASLCTTDDVCAAGICVGKLAVVCPAPEGCLQSLCNPDTGVCAPTLAPDGAPCDDGDPCLVGERCVLGECGGAVASTACCAQDADCHDGTPCTADICDGGLCRYTAVDLPACVGRIVVAGKDDAELRILDAETLAPIDGGAIGLAGAVHMLAAAPSAGVVYAAVPDDALGVVVLDPLQPTAAPPRPQPLAPGGGSLVAVDDAARTLAVLFADGSVETFDTRTAGPLSSGVVVAPPAGPPALDPETGWLYVPSGGGHLAVIELTVPLAELASTPWFVGGAPVAAAHDAAGERVFLSDPLNNAVRVLGALHGSGVTGDSIVGFGAPGGVTVDVGGGRLLVVYPEAAVVRTFDLDTLQLIPPVAVSVSSAPVATRVDPLTGRIYVTAATGSQLVVLDGMQADLPQVAGSPAPVAFGPIDVAIFWSRPGHVVITEAMVNPTAVDDADGEWLELHNPGAATVLLDGWRLETDFTFHVIDAPSLEIPAQGHVVVCRNADLATNGGVACDYEYGVLPLANDGTNVFVSTPSGAQADHAALAAPIPAGQTLALRHAAYDNGRRYSWTTSAGTPGATNTDVADEL